jgi:hypothetical protein
MNERQRRVFLWGVAVMALMGLFPPWVFTFDSGTRHFRKSAGYAFILSPPKPKEQGYFEDADAVIDASKLYVQWGVVAVVTTWLALCLHWREGAVSKIFDCLVRWGYVDDPSAKSAQPTSAIETDIKCDKCGSVVVIKKIGIGECLACSNPKCPDSLEAPTRPA